MSKSRMKFTADFKTRVALDALSGEQSLSELASKHACIQIRFLSGNSRPRSRLQLALRASPRRLSRMMKPVSRSFMPRLANLLWRRIFYSKPSPKFELRAKA